MSPRQKPGRSKQDYGTPSDFIVAVEERFGAIDIDLAASQENAVAPRKLTQADDSLSVHWRQLIGPGEVAWLNPPFAKIGPWALRCQLESHYLRGGARILMLVPASIGSDWFREQVHPYAYVHALTPRLKFVGCKDAYPKDCILVEYGARPGFDVWRWKS